MTNNFFLYLVTEQSYLQKKTLPAAVEDAIKGGASMVQLREKNISYEEFKKIALDVQKITSKYNVPLIINDNINLANDINADGVHLGQTDGYRSCRKYLKNKIIGISVSSYDEALEAIREQPDYLGVGSIFPTITKSDAKIVSETDLKNILEKINIPLVLIGGITKETIKQLRSLGAKYFAISSAILQDENRIIESTIEIKEEICKKF